MVCQIPLCQVSRRDNKIIARTIVKLQTHNLKYYSISNVFFFLSGPSDEEETLTQNMFQIAQHTNFFYLHDLFLETPTRSSQETKRCFTSCVTRHLKTSFMSSVGQPEISGKFHSSWRTNFRGKLRAHLNLQPFWIYNHSEHIVRLNFENLPLVVRSEMECHQVG